MRRGPLILCATVALLLAPARAPAAPVLVLGHDGRVTRRDDRFLAAPQAPGSLSAVPVPGEARPAVRRGGPGGAGLGGGGGPAKPPPSPKPGGGAGGKGGAGGTRGRPAVTVASTLGALERRGAITRAAEQATLGAFDAALAAERRLTGTRHEELSAVTETIHDLAVAHELTPSRLPALTATLQANTRWWSTGPSLSADARVEFTGSQLVWQYYPGQGLQLQVLGSFGRADGLYTAGPSEYPAMEQLLAEIIPLAAERAGGLTWEYYFAFDGGSAPWASAMAQATGLEALTRAYLATHNPYYLQVAAQAMPIFSRPPPQGVTVTTPRGVRFLQYTFAPHLAIINAFLQTLIGLDTYAQVSHDPNAARLFAKGNAEAEWEMPQYNTGAWSLYAPGEEDDLSYHELVTGFLQQLCQLDDAPVYCTAAEQFGADLTTPPVLDDLTARVVPQHPFALRFRLSKISHVGVTIERGADVVFATSASFPHGTDSFAVPKLARGGYTVTLTATDLVGNFTRTLGTLVVAR